MFAQGQSLIIRHFGQVARICGVHGSMGFHQLLHKHDIRTASTYEREGISHFGVRIPGSHSLRNERFYAVIDLLPDFFDLARRAQVSLNRGITHLTMYATRDKPLEPLAHIRSFPCHIALLIISMNTVYLNEELPILPYSHSLT